MKRLTFLFAVVLLPWSLTLSAQSTAVQGRVFDAETGLPIPFVNVALTAAGTGTMTNQKGEFQLKTEERPGRISVSFLGYGSKNIEITRGISQSIDIALEPRSIELLAAEVRPD